MSLREYLERLREGIELLHKYDYTESIQINEQIRPNKQAVVNAKLVLNNGSVLYIKEYIDAKHGTDRVTYAYHFNDRDGKLLFRYDNAVHKPALRFKAHKHNADGTIEYAALPDIFDLVDDIIGYL
jgi:hypothetical protein